MEFEASIQPLKKKMLALISAVDELEFIPVDFGQEDDSPVNHRVHTIKRHNLNTLTVTLTGNFESSVNLMWDKGGVRVFSFVI